MEVLPIIYLAYMFVAIYMLMFTFLYNIPICLKAFVDLVVHRILRKNHSVWVKTHHLGNGNCYITNQTKLGDRR